MNASGNPGADGPHGRMDGTDLAILAELADLYTAADPVPRGLVDRIQFALALDDADAEMMRLVEETTLASGARGERSRIITFAGATTTMTIRVAALGGGTVRIDGWLAPPAALRVTLRSATVTVDRIVDHDGRFAFEEVPRGPAQLIVRPAGADARTGNAMATLAVVL